MWAQGIGAGPESQLLARHCAGCRRSLPCSAARPRRRAVDPWALSTAFPLVCLHSDLGTGVGLAAPLLQVFAKGLGQTPAPVFGFCSSPLGDAGPARIFPPAHKPRPPQTRDGGMVRGAPSGVKGACPAHAGCGMVGARKPWCRRSSGVEHALGKGGVEGSIPSGGTTKFLEIIAISDLPDRAGLGNVRGMRGGKWGKSGKRKGGGCARNARELGDGKVGEGGKLTDSHGGFCVSADEMADAAKAHPLSRVGIQRRLAPVAKGMDSLDGRGCRG